MTNANNRGRAARRTSIPAIEAVTERDNVLHKWAEQKSFDPVFIESAEGSRIVDAEGVAYLDAFSGSWYAVSGHGNQVIADAIGAQATQLATIHAAGFSTTPRRRLARRLLDLLPAGFRRVFFGANGSDAVEASLKLARLGTGRQGVVSFSGSYHGASMGATSVTGMPECREGFGEPVPGTVFAPYPYCYRCPLGLSYPSCDIRCAELVEHAIQTEGPERMAAVIAEPVIGVNGVIVPPQPYWTRIREITNRYDMWLIFDEVVTAFGRCGSWFAADYFGVHPDVITLGKGLTSGYQALSAAVFADRAAEAVSSRTLYHGMSFDGHAVACAAALANLDFIEANCLIERSAELGDVLGESLRSLGDRHVSVGDVRGIGAMWGIELVRDRASRTSFLPGAPFRASDGRQVDAAHWARQELFREHQVYTGVATNVIVIAPPLEFTQTEVDELTKALTAVLARIDGHCN